MRSSASHIDMCRRLKLLLVCAITAMNEGCEGELCIYEQPLGRENGI